MLLVASEPLDSVQAIDGPIDERTGYCGEMSLTVDGVHGVA